MASSDAAPVPLLQGVRIVSFGAFVAGNVCPLLLAELGADVVKVESRDHPEALRSYAAPDQPGWSEPSGIPTTPLFAGMTRNMRSVAIAMMSDAGRATLHSLVARADVLIENLGPGTMESWGCSFAELVAYNPRLVMVSISGYGKSGPLAKFRAYASNINNYLGLTTAWALDGTYFDFVAGIHGASAVVAALAAVDRGAPGVFVDLAQTESGAAVMAPLYLDFLANGREWSAEPNEVPGSLFSAVIRCDGPDAWVAIELEDAEDWDVVCDHLERPDLKLDGNAVPERCARLRGEIEAWARTRTPLQVATELQRAGLAVAPVQNSEDLWRDAQLRSRDAYVDVSHPDIGIVEYPRTLHRLSASPALLPRRSPRLGEHTNEVLAEWAGLDEATLADLAARGAIWQPGERDAGNN
jgi:benzylsuccinate CoA-transferase BbsF subunit